MSPRFLIACLVLSLSVAFGGNAGRALAATSVPSLGTEAQDWNLILKEVDRYIRGGAHDEPVSEGQRYLLKGVRERAAAAKSAALQRLRSVQRLLDALGPPPDKDKPPEPVEIAAQRRRYDQDMARYRAQVAEAEVALTRTSQLETALSTFRRKRLFERLLEPHPLPLAPHSIGVALSEFFEELAALLESPAKWFGGLPPVLEEKVLIFPAVVVLFLAAFLGWWLRGALLRRFGRDPAEEAPTYTRRFLAAIAEGVARGIVPAAILAVFFFWFGRPAALSVGLFSQAVRSLLMASFFFVLVVAFSRAVLAPELPAWRLSALAPENALLINRRITVLAAIFAVDLFHDLASRGMEPTKELLAIILTVFGTLEAVAILELVRGGLWRPELEEPSPPGAEEGSPEAPPEGGRFWTFLRRVAGAVAIAGMAALFVGYPILGKWLISNVILTALVLGLLALLRGLLHELFVIFAESALVLERLRVRPRILEAVRSWERLVVDSLLYFFGVMVIAPMWGVPPEDLLRWAGGVLTGFSIGKVRISIVDMGLAIVVFFAAMGATRFAQRHLVDRVLAKTNLTVSVRHSVAAAVGYIGVVLAAILSIAVTGVDLTNFALVAGALSVGIGFGLQNVVNNFVSGVILLVERPIKVGDWVIVGEKEGIVQRVNFRATELQTWQRASVIIPNAEILSNAVVNLTHKDDYGRIEIFVGVAYGSDTTKVKEILAAVARDHPKVEKYPAPLVLFQAFGSSSLDFELRCYTANVMERWVVASELRFEIDRRFRAEGVQIPFPQRVVHFAPSDGKRKPAEEEAEGLPASFFRSEDPPGPERT